MNKILFPTYQNGGNQQSITDNATGIIYGNFPTNTVRHRDRVSGQRDRPVLRRSGARRPARVQVRLRLLARRRPRTRTTPRRQRDDDLHQRERRVRAAERHAVRDAAERRDRAQRARAVRAGQLQRQAADRHRRPPLRAARGLPAGAVEPGVAVRGGRHRRLRRAAAQLRRDPRHREVEHGRAARQRGLRPHRRRQDGREGVGRRATTTCCRPAAAASATSTANANYSEHVHVERPATATTSSSSASRPARRSSAPSSSTARSSRRSIRTSAGRTPTSTASAWIAS